MRTSTTPRPLAAAVGLAAAATDQVRRLPERLLTLPTAAVRVAQAGRSRYDELVEHGRDVLSGTAREATWAAASVAETAADDVGRLADRVVGDTEQDAPGDGEEVRAAADSERATSQPPAGTVPPPGAGEQVELPPDLADEVAARTPGAVLDHGDLPLDDFDHLTVPQLRSRIRPLDVPSLVQLRDYERAHAARLPVITLLENRILALVESG